MITKETVLVLGAGASMPYKFPSGQGLIDSICTTPINRHRIAESAGVSEGDVWALEEALKFAEPESIDVFLEKNPTFEKIGKAAIAATLLPLEKRANLFENWQTWRQQGVEPESGGNWYNLLARLLNSSFDDYEKNQLSIITFNYDRSLEYYLFTTLNASFQEKTPDECAKKVNGLDIIHVYGQIGYLPWQEPGSQEIIRYDQRQKWDVREWKMAIQTAMRCIKTMHESYSSAPHIKNARVLLTHAQVIYFLGFGYHSDNMEILGIQALGQAKRIRGTSKGLSAQRKSELAKLGINSLRPNIAGPGSPARGLFVKDIYDFLHDDVVF